MHVPVLRDKVLEFLEPLEGKVILDATVGIGGHAVAILEKLGPKGKLIGLDQDADALELAKEKLFAFGSRVSLFEGNFSQMDDVLRQSGIAEVDGVVMDLGVSSLQLDSGERGFSFQLDGPLDMRMDRRQQLTAREIVNRYDEERLGGLLREYGQERFARRIAAAIIWRRKKAPILTTKELADTVGGAIPRRAWPKQIHPATKTFQALRIVVNNEMSRLEQGLEKAAAHLKTGGRLVVLSYHSLEDRIVKMFFRNREQAGWNLLTRKPVAPDEAEIHENRRARSAKLRVLEKAA